MVKRKELILKEYCKDDVKTITSKDDIRIHGEYEYLYKVDMPNYNSKFFYIKHRNYLRLTEISIPKIIFNYNVCTMKLINTYYVDGRIGADFSIIYKPINPINNNGNECCANDQINHEDDYLKSYSAKDVLFVTGFDECINHKDFEYLYMVKKDYNILPEIQVKYGNVFINTYITTAEIPNVDNIHIYFPLHDNQEYCSTKIESYFLCEDSNIDVCLSTDCIVCGNQIPITTHKSEYNHICEECKNVILYYKKQMNNKNVKIRRSRRWRKIY